MYFGNSRKQLFLLSAIGVLMVILVFISFINIGQKDTGLTIWSYIFLFLFLIDQLYIMKKIIDITDERKVENHVSNKVIIEATNLELKYKEEQTQKEEKEKQEKASSEQLENLLPKGAFKKVDNFCLKLIENIANSTEALQGIVYLNDKETGDFKPKATFAIDKEIVLKDFKLGEGLTGQAAENKDIIEIDEVPENYTAIESGLGKAKTTSLVFVPIVHKEETLALIELGYYKKINEDTLALLKNVSSGVAIKINDLINS